MAKSACSGNGSSKPDFGTKLLTKATKTKHYVKDCSNTLCKYWVLYRFVKKARYAAGFFGCFGPGLRGRLVSVVMSSARAVRAARSSHLPVVLIGP